MLLKRIKHPPWITLASIAYGATGLNVLIKFWIDSPYEHFAWIPLIIWIIPAIKLWTDEFSLAQSIVVALAIFIIFLGGITSFNSFKFLGLAFAITSLVPWSFKTWIWLCCSLSWFPAFGWVAFHLYPNINSVILLLARVFFALLSVIFMFRRT